MASMDELDLLNMPWVDTHVHVQTLSWNDAETFALGGARGLVMIATNYHWSPYRPVRPDDVLWLWDLAIKWCYHIQRGHFYHVRAAVAIHTLAKVEGWQNLLKRLPEYYGKPEVVAAGEFGIEPVQYGISWPLEEQKEVVREQLRLAKEYGIPVIIHTPVQKLYQQGWDEQLTDPLLPWPKAKVEAARIDLELIEEVGLNEREVIIDHADRSIVDMILGDTRCNLAFSIGSPWRGVTAADIAHAIGKYGPERILIDTDLIGNMYGDMLAMPRMILDLYRYGVSKEAIRQVVFENANRLFKGVFSTPV